MLDLRSVNNLNEINLSICLIAEETKTNSIKCFIFALFSDTAAEWSERKIWHVRVRRGSIVG